MFRALQPGTSTTTYDAAPSHGVCENNLKYTQSYTSNSFILRSLGLLYQFLSLLRISYL